MSNGWIKERKLTLKQRDEIIKLYLDRYPVLKIAKLYNIHHSTIYYYVKDVKHLRKKNRPKTFLSEINKMSKSKNRYATKIKPSGLMYEDYIRIKNEREHKKEMERLFKKE